MRGREVGGEGFGLGTTDVTNQTLSVHGPPHGPAPVEPRRLIPEGPLLVRGLALLAVTAAAILGMTAAIQKAGWLCVKDGNNQFTNPPIGAAKPTG